MAAEPDASVQLDRLMSKPPRDAIDSLKALGFTSLGRASILSSSVIAADDTGDAEHLERLYKTPTAEMSDDDVKCSRAVAAQYGLVMGDSLGAPLEFSGYNTREPNTVTELDNELFRGLMGAGFNRFGIKAGQWTDDTSMSLCLLDSLLVHYPAFEPVDLRLRFLAWWAAGYNNAFGYDRTSHSKGRSVGLGGNIGASFADFERSPTAATTAGDRKTSGNGSIMRLAPVPIRYARAADLEEARKTAWAQSKTTHQGDEAADCARLLTHLIIKAINHPSRDPASVRRDVLEDIPAGGFEAETYSVSCLAASTKEKKDPSNAGLDLKDRKWCWKKADFKYCKARAEEMPGYVGSYAMDGLAMALHCVYTTGGFREALVKAVNMRGDADTVGAITGQLAGAIYGLEQLPESWREAVTRWDPGQTIPLRALKLYLGNPPRRLAEAEARGDAQAAASTPPGVLTFV